MSTRKGFSKRLFDENDQRAKDAARDLVVSLGIHALVENPKKQGADLIGLDKKGNEVLYLEVEVKRVWKAGVDFPYPDVNLPQRKDRYLDAKKFSKPVIFAIFNEDLSKVALFGRDAVAKAKLEEVPNRFISEGEMFYKIPLDKVRFVDIGGPYVKNVLRG